MSAGRKNTFAVVLKVVIVAVWDFGISRHRKFKEEHDMASKEARERKLKEIQEIAQGWGKIIAHEAFPQGPGLDVSLADMEEIAAMASQALVKGAVQEMTSEQGKQLGQESACPTCQRHAPCK
jgi:hypothetical protein